MPNRESPEHSADSCFLTVFLFPESKNGTQPPSVTGGRGEHTNHSKHLKSCFYSASTHGHFCTFLFFSWHFKDWISSVPSTQGGETHILAGVWNHSWALELPHKFLGDKCAAKIFQTAFPRNVLVSSDREQVYSYFHTYSQPKPKLKHICIHPCQTNEHSFLAQSRGGPRTLPYQYLQLVLDYVML